jgi:hypothetical protein
MELVPAFSFSDEYLFKLRRGIASLEEIIRLQVRPDLLPALFEAQAILAEIEEAGNLFHEWGIEEIQERMQWVADQTAPIQTGSN